MKVIRSWLLLLAFAFAVPASQMAIPVAVQAAEPADTQAIIDAEIAAKIADIETEQDAYFATWGSYCQLLNTHTTIPTASTAPDNLGAQPPSQNANWLDFGMDATPMRARWKVTKTAYTGSLFGWQFIAETKISGVTYQRGIGFGHNAAGKTFAWKSVP